MLIFYETTKEKSFKHEVYYKLLDTFISSTDSRYEAGNQINEYLSFILVLTNEVLQTKAKTYIQQ